MAPRANVGPVARVARALGVAPADNLKAEQRTVLETLRKYANDPASVEVVEWKDPAPCNSTHDGAACDTAVAVTVRARNGLGALTVDSLVYFLKDGAVVDRLSRSWDAGLHNYYMGHIYRDRDPDPLGTAIQKEMAEPAIK